MEEPREVKIPIEKQSPSGSSDGDGEPPLLCLFCKKKSENKFTPIMGNDTILNALNILRIEYKPLESVVDYICYTCMYRINVIIDFRRIMLKNIKESRANYFLNKGDKEMYKQYLKANKPEVKKVIETGPIISNNNSPCSIRISSVKSIRTEVTNTDMDMLFDSFHQIVYNDGNDTSLLNVLREQPESVLATESGGSIHNYNETNSISSKSPFKCNYCSKIYNRYSQFVKHQRSHTIRFARKKTFTKVVYNCSECDETFSTSAELKKHSKIHKPQMECNICGKTFLLKNDLQFHEAECIGRYDATEGRRYRTRSQNKSEKISNCNYPDDDEAFSEIESCYSTKRKIVSWLTTNNQDDDTSSVYSALSAISNISSNASTIAGKRRASIKYGKKGKKRKKLFGEGYLHKCLEKNCTYKTSSLDALMMHDANIHNLPMLYYCKKCNKRFVRKDYLDRHLRYQISGRFVCFKCEKVFIYEFELKLHFKEHENASYICEICRLSFITEHEYEKHLMSSRHVNKENMKPTIFEDRLIFKHESATSSPEPERTDYSAQIKILHLMECERLEKYESNTWRLGYVVKKLPTENCSGSIDFFNCR